MEERSIDELRKKSRPLEEGEQREELTDEELLLISEEAQDEYDEDLVGLTPSQLKKALEERERAKAAAIAERDRLLSEAEDAVKTRDWEKAEAFFSQAALLDGDCVRAKEGIWLARTRDFTDAEELYRQEIAEEASDEEARALLKERMGELLLKERAQYAAEEAPLAEKFFQAQSTRQAAFDENRKYYRIRFSVFFGLFLLFAAAAGISSYYIVRTMTNVPIILTIAFGAVALVALTVALVFSRSLYLAGELCRKNKKLSSTEDGKRLAYLRERLACLELVLKDGEQEE